MSYAPISLEEVFTQEQSVVVREYISEMIRAIRQHDQSFLVARKAVCLYRAFAKNGLMERDDCQRVFTSRALYYPGLLGLSSRVALIDDVAVTRVTLARIAHLIERRRSACDVYLAAQSSSEELQPMGRAFLNVVREMPSEAVFELVRRLTHFVQMSGITNNSDQPIMVSKRKVAIGEFVRRHSVCDVSRDNQLARGITNATVTFNASAFLRGLPIEADLGKAMVKARVFCDGEVGRVSVVPFVILPRLKAEEVNGLFDRIASDELKECCPVATETNLIAWRSSIESRLRIVSYALSALLGKRLASTYFEEAGGLERDLDHERMLFGKNLDEYAWSGLDIARDLDEAPIDGLTRSDLDRAVGNFRLKVLLGKERHDDDHIGVSDVRLAANESQMLPSADTATALSSATLDVLIDESLLVPCPPTTVHKDTPPIAKGVQELEQNTFERFYRHGEIHRLTRLQVLALADALKKIVCELDDGPLSRAAVNRLGVLYERFIRSRTDGDALKQGVDESSPFVFSYLGESWVDGEKDPEVWDLARVLVALRPAVQDQIEDDVINREMTSTHANKGEEVPLSLQQQAQIYAEAVGVAWKNSKPFKGKTIQSFLEKLILLDDRYQLNIVMDKYQHIKRLATIEMHGDECQDRASNVRKDLEAQRHKLADDTLPGIESIINTDGLRALELDCIQQLMPPKYYEGGRPSLLGIFCHVDSYLNKLADNDSQAAADEAEVVDAAFGILVDLERRGRPLELVMRGIGAINYFYSSKGFGIVLADLSGQTITALTSSRVATGDAGGILFYFPDDALRPLFVHGSDEPTIAADYGRKEDIETVFPQRFRDFCVQYADKFHKGGESRLVIVSMKADEDFGGILQQLEREGVVLRLSSDAGQCDAFGSARPKINVWSIDVRRVTPVTYNDNRRYDNRQYTNAQNGTQQVGKGNIAGNNNRAVSGKRNAMGDNSTIVTGNHSRASVNSHAASEEHDWATLLDEVVAGCKEAGMEDAMLVEGLVQRIKRNVDAASSDGANEQKKSLLDRIKGDLDNIALTIGSAMVATEAAAKLMGVLDSAKDAVLGLFQ